MHVPELAVQIDLSDVSWRSTEVPGVVWYPLHLDDHEEFSPDGAEGERGDSVVLIRMDPGVGYERHRHIGPESVLVLQGGYRDEMGDVRRGEFARYGAGSVHTPVALGDASQPRGPENPACVLYAVASGGIELLGR